MPKVLTDEPNCRIWLSAKHQTYSRIKSATENLLYNNEDFRNSLSVRVFPKGHLGKTPQKPLAGVEPANLWPSSRFHPAGIALK